MRAAPTDERVTDRPRLALAPRLERERAELRTAHLLRDLAAVVAHLSERIDRLERDEP